MSPASQFDIDPSFLGSEAKTVALDVAAQKQLFLSPEALASIDTMVAERKQQIAQSWRDLNAWKQHVRHISAQVAAIYLSRGVKRITDPNEFLETSRTVYAFYPYD